ncbi:MAG: sugar phosphate isomerase/epimerase [Clostridia bacterium]|nr:sugar phosphate isomerase/epimerase [Clostridia bacterium]
MKKSINAWMVSDTTGFAEMFEELKRAGFEAVELNLDKKERSHHSLSLETTDEELAAIRTMAEEAGLEIASVSSSLYGTLMGDTSCHEELDKILFCHIRLAKKLGVDSILVVPGADICGGADIRTAYDTCFSYLNGRKEKIEQEGVYVCLENVWNGFFTSPFDMASFIDRLDSPYIKAYYDVGNTVAFSDTASWIRILGNRIERIHVKGYKRSSILNTGGAWVDLPDGSINWKDVLKALAEIGYDGYFTAEVTRTREYENDMEFYKEVAKQENDILGGN